CPQLAHVSVDPLADIVRRRGPHRGSRVLACRGVSAGIPRVGMGRGRVGVGATGALGREACLRVRADLGRPGGEVDPARIGPSPDLVGAGAVLAEGRAQGVEHVLEALDVVRGGLAGARHGSCPGRDSGSMSERWSFAWTCDDSMRLIMRSLTLVT